MKTLSFTYCLLLPLLFITGGVVPASAQRFSVTSFKVLPNDVSAFINPVRDLNDEDCGLVKVIASEDFVFSTPLGIVKRVDKVGEIWLYIPRGSKKITIKHAEWGVLRDYMFSSKIDSHKTYELRVSEPVKHVEAVYAPQEVTIVRDTLVLTRVDTLVVQPVVKRVPFNFDVVATAGYGGRNGNMLGGILLMALKRHGAFVHLASDFGHVGTVKGQCGKDGEVKGSIPFYTGHTRKSTYMINAGLAHRIAGNFAVYEGVGYSSSALAWQLAPSEGGGYLKNNYYSLSGVSCEVGAVYAFKRISVTASVATLKGKEWYGSIGIGIRLGR